MVKIKFKYRDELSNWEWREQECVVKDVEECIKIYGLGVDCDYEILEVTEVDKCENINESTNLKDEFVCGDLKVIALGCTESDEEFDRSSEMSSYSSYNIVNKDNNIPGLRDLYIDVTVKYPIAYCNIDEYNQEVDFAEEMEIDRVDFVDSYLAEVITEEQFKQKLKSSLKLAGVIYKEDDYKEAFDTIYKDAIDRIREQITDDMLQESTKYTEISESLHWF